MSVLELKSYHDGAYRAFGFLTTKEFATQFTQSCARLRRSKRTLRRCYKHDMHKASTIALNASVYLGYIPFIGVFIGTFKFWIAWKATQYPQGKEKVNASIQNANVLASRAFVVRGIVEVSGLGLFLLPADFYITYKRRQNPISVEDVIATGCDDYE
jgi:hypothetical protein